MFEFIDVDNSLVQFEEFKDGLNRLPYTPKLWITHKDWDTFISAKVLDGNGCLDRAGFEECILFELKNFSNCMIDNEMDVAIIDGERTVVVQIILRTKLQ
jgi:hypothetical protein